VIGLIFGILGGVFAGLIGSIGEAFGFGSSGLYVSAEMTGHGGGQ